MLTVVPHFGNRCFMAQDKCGTVPLASFPSVTTHLRQTHCLEEEPDRQWKMKELDELRCICIVWEMGAVMNLEKSGPNKRGKLTQL